MRLAVLLPGYLDSPDYLHMKVFNTRLIQLGYNVETLDPCNLWKSHFIPNYNITNYLHQIEQTIDKFEVKNLEELILIGHSLGAYVSIIAGNTFRQVSKIIALCPPSSVTQTHNWKPNEVRSSKRDLPQNPKRFRKFNIPYSFYEDAKKYSALNAISKIGKPLMILIGLLDTIVLPSNTELLIKNACHPYVVRLSNIGHNFRKSYTETEIVMNEIENFLNKN